MSEHTDDVVTIQHLHPHERLRLLRERKAIRQADFAAQLDVTQSTISHWENGTTTPSKSARENIAEILGTDPYSCECCGR